MDTGSILNVREQTKGKGENRSHSKSCGRSLDGAACFVRLWSIGIFTPSDRSPYRRNQMVFRGLAVPYEARAGLADANPGSC